MRPTCRLAYVSYLLFLLAAASAAAQDRFSAEIVYTGDFVANVSGGLKQDATYLDNVDIQVTGDFSDADSGAKLRLFAYGLGNQGGDPSSFIGDAQVVNNIEAPTSWRLYEAFAEFVDADSHFSLMAGLYDLNSEFDVIHSAGRFLNSSFGIGPDFSQTSNGPSIFPVTALAARLAARPAPGLTVRAAVFDGVAGNPDNLRGTHVILDADDGLLLTGEVEWTRSLHALSDRSEPGESPAGGLGRFSEPAPLSRAVVGVWTYTRDFSRIDEPGTGTSRGIYALAETRLTGRKPDARRGLAAFARVGLASNDVNRFGSYAGGGLTLAGPFRTRPDDEAGLAVAVAVNGDPAMRSIRAGGGDPTRAESAWEAYYLATLTSYAQVQADMQYVQNPNTRASIDNALVLSMRMILTLP